MRFLALFVGLVLASPVWAGQHLGGYIGASLGKASTDIPSVAFGRDAILEHEIGEDCVTLSEIEGFRCTSSIDDDDQVFKVFGGYQFNRNFAVEGFYTQLGDYSSAAHGRFNHPSLNNEAVWGVDADVDGDAFGVAAVGFLPVTSNFDVLGKVGLARWDVDGQVRLTSATRDGIATIDDDGNVVHHTATFRDSDSGTDPVIGAGVQYRLETFSIRAEAERYRDVAGSDVDILSVGLIYGF